MKKTSSERNFICQFGNDANLEILSLSYSFKLYICQYPRINRAYTAQNTEKSALLACLAQRLSAFTSRRGTDMAGRGALELSLKDGARTNYLTENSSSASRILRPRRKKSPDRIPEKKSDHISIYEFFSTSLMHRFRGKKNERARQCLNRYFLIRRPRC